MKNNDSSISTSSLVIVLIIFTAVILFILSFLFVKFDEANNKKKSVVTTETVSLVYAGDNNGIKLDNSKILSDEIAVRSKEKQSYFDFDVVSKLNSSAVSIDYEVALDKSNNCNLGDNNIMVYVEKQNDGTYSKISDPKLFLPITKKSDLGVNKGSMILLSGNYTGSKIDRYRLRVWVSDHFDSSSPVVCDLSVKLYAKVDK